MTVERPRKRLKRIESVGHARFITCSCWQRLNLLGRADLRDAFVRQISIVQQRGAFQLPGWVIMPEHFHLLLIPSLPEWPLKRVLNAIKTPFAKEVLARWRLLSAPVLPQLRDWNQQERFWQRGGGYDRNIVSDAERLEKIEYMHNNPVARGLVQTPTDWRWSSARAYAGHDEVMLMIDRIN